MKLIDKDAVVAEIERLKKINQAYKKTWKWKFKWFYCTIIGRLEVLEGLKNYINNREVKEVDLDFAKEVDVWVRDNGDTNGFFNVQELAKHFFALGLKASSNISIEVTSIDEELKENGIDPNSKEAKIIKESYYTAIEKLSEQKESLEECGFNDLKDEFKDVVKALKGE